jgi:hypothetical protein
MILQLQALRRDIEDFNNETRKDLHELNIRLTRLEVKVEERSGFIMQMLRDRVEKDAARRDWMTTLGAVVLGVVFYQIGGWIRARVEEERRAEKV